MKNARTLSLILAAAMNLLPIARLGIATAHINLRPTYAVVFQWLGITATLLGSYDAVSGASTVITSPSTASGKVGEPFSYRITSAPDQGNVFRASPLPPGLSLGTTRRTRSFISGIPSEAGSYELTIVASDDDRPSRTISKILTIDIEADAIPINLLSPPLDQNLDTGKDLLLSILATGTQPITYQWFHDDQPLPEQMGPVLRIRGIDEGHSGSYYVKLFNSVSSIVSKPVQVTVSRPTPITPARIAKIIQNPPGVALEITGTPGATVTLESTSSIKDTSWTVFTTVNLSTEGKTKIEDRESHLVSRFYRIRSN